MRKASRDLALCGVLCALAVAIMAMGTIIPVATYCCPLLASMTIVPVLILCGEKLSWAMFAASAILSLLLAPDKEAAAIFLALGYYPIVKPKLDRMKKPRRAALKLLLFNAAIFAVYGALLFIFRLDALREELFSMGLWLSLALILGGNVIFWLDDKLLERAVPRIAALCARWTLKAPIIRKRRTGDCLPLL